MVVFTIGCYVLEGVEEFFLLILLISITLAMFPTVLLGKFLRMLSLT